jgi:hypothetical protein
MDNKKIKLVTFLLVTITLVLALLTGFSASQMAETQTRVNVLQAQIGQYENMSDSLQTQAANLQAELGLLQNPVDNITFTDISVTQWQPDPLVGYPYSKFLNVTIKNFGTESLGGFVLNVEVVGNTTNLAPIGIHVSNQGGVLHVAESKSMKVQLITANNRNTDTFMGCSLKLALILDDAVLDTKTVKMGI